MYRLLSIFILFGMTSLVFALPSDAKEKVYIQADSIIYNYKTGINVYQGHVIIDQGTTHVTSDRLITKNNEEHKIKEAIAYGLTTRAHYWTLPKENEPIMNAYANVIQLHPIEQTVTLEKNVLVTQGHNQFQGQIVHYNKLDQTVIVPPTKGARAVIVYDPNQKNAEKPL